MNTPGNHIVQDRLEGVEPEAGDDEGSKRRDTSRNEGYAEDANDIDPLFGIGKALSYLAPVKVWWSVLAHLSGRTTNEYSGFQYYLA